MVVGSSLNSERSRKGIYLKPGIYSGGTIGASGGRAE